MAARIPEFMVALPCICILTARCFLGVLTMAKTDPTKEIERPDAWNRFERAVDAAIKSGPKHRVAKKKKTAPKKVKKG